MRLIIKFIVVMATVSILVVLLAWGYSATKESYRVVGFNDGTIDANSKIIEKLRVHGEIARCETVGEGAVIIELVTAKADSVYLAKNDAGIVFCEYQ